MIHMSLPHGIISASCRWTEILLMRIMSMPILRSISALPMPFSGAWRMAMSLWAKDFFEAQYLYA